MTKQSHAPAGVNLLKRSIAFPFVEAKRQVLTADILKSVADRNGSAVERVAVWLMEGATVATDFCTYELAPRERGKPDAWRVGDGAFARYYEGEDAEARARASDDAMDGRPVRPVYFD